MRIAMMFVCSLLSASARWVRRPGPCRPRPTSKCSDQLKLQSPKLDKWAFLAALTAIDAGLTVNEDQALRRAANVCLDIKQGDARTR